MRFLLVDDNRLNTLMLEKIIKSTLPTSAVDIAANASQAKDFLASGDYDYYILDGDLNDTITGCELANNLWQTHPQARVIAYTASEHMEEQFKTVFAKHGKPYQAWPKQVTETQVLVSIGSDPGMWTS